jgi:ADP-ribose pyrophosphatase
MEKPPQIPSDAVCVFRGELFDVYQWEQEQFDGSKKTFEYLSRKHGAFVIPVLENGNLLIAFDEQPGRPPKLTFPGGGLEDNESPEEGARREFLEETGYEATELVPWLSVKPVAKMNWFIYVFVGRKCKKISEPKPDPGERIVLKEITFDEFIALADDPEFQYSLLIPELLRAKYSEEHREALKKRLFG